MMFPALAVAGVSALGVEIGTDNGSFALMVATIICLVLKWIDDNRKHKVTEVKVNEVQRQVQASNGTPTAHIVEGVKSDVAEVKGNVDQGTEILRELRSTLANFMTRSATIQGESADDRKVIHEEIAELRTDLAAMARQVGISQRPSSTRSRVSDKRSNNASGKTTPTPRKRTPPPHSKQQ